MSLNTAVCLAQRNLPEVLQITVVPFLYQTRTLLSGLSAGTRRTARQDTGRPRKRFSSTKADRSFYRLLESGPDTPRYSRDERKSISPHWSPAAQGDALDREKSLRWPSDTERVVGESEPPAHTPASSLNSEQPSEVQERKPRSSTITASEKAVFDRILNEISNNKIEKFEAEAREMEEEEYLEDDSVGEEDIIGDAREQLAAIFQKAITAQGQADLKSDWKGNDAVVTPSYKRTLNLSSDKLGRATFGRRESFRRSDLEQALPVAVEEQSQSSKYSSDDHKQTVDTLLDAANTDVEIWAVLEKKVFSLMTQLNRQTKLEDKARKADRRKQQKAAKLALINHSTEPPPELPKPARSATTETPPSSPSPISDSKALTSNNLLTLIQATYAHHCLHALRLFRNLNLSSPYALHLLPHIKSLGPVSYVLGASTDLYNEVLFQKWTQFSDVQGMADLMEEMVNQGIGANVTTLELLRFVDRYRRQDLRGDHGGGKKTWWALRPVREGWTRVKALYGRFMEEMGERGEWDKAAMKMERRALLRSQAVEKEWLKGRAEGGGKPVERVEGGLAFRKLVSETPLVKHLTSDKGSVGRANSVRERRRGRTWGMPSSERPRRTGRVTRPSARLEGSSLRDRPRVGQGGPSLRDRPSVKLGGSSLREWE